MRCVEWRADWIESLRQGIAFKIRVGDFDLKITPKVILNREKVFRHQVTTELKSLIEDEVRKELAHDLGIEHPPVLYTEREYGRRSETGQKLYRHRIYLASLELMNFENSFLPIKKHDDSWVHKELTTHVIDHGHIKHHMDTILKNFHVDLINFLDNDRRIILNHPLINIADVQREHNRYKVSDIREVKFTLNGCVYYIAPGEPMAIMDGGGGCASPI